MTHDAHASMADLNVLLDVKEVDIGERSMEFGHETERLSSPVCHLSIHSFPIHLNLVVVDKGLAVSNAYFIRQAHNVPAPSVIIYHDPRPSLEPDLLQTRRYTKSNKRTRNQIP